jgi:glycosyltransferase involved in cell wall biosynthesis
MQARRVALFLPSLFFGGLQRLLLTLANGFVAHGLDVELIVAMPRGEFLTEVPTKARLIDLGIKAGRGWEDRAILSLPALARYLLQERPPILLSPPMYANFVAVLASRFTGCRTRTLAIVDYTMSAFARSVKWHQKAIPLLASRLLPLADDVVATYRQAAVDLALLTRLPPERIQVIYPPVVTPELLQKAKVPVTHPWFQPKDGAVLVSAGRLVPEKDFATLLRAIALVRREVDVRLLILGEGPQRRSLETLVSQLHLTDMVQMPGFVSNPYAYMRLADAFVLSSSLEAFGIVIVEALALGTPVICTDTSSGGPAEILENGKYGKLVPVGDAKGLAVGILETLDNPQDPEMLRARAKDFSQEEVISRYLELLNLHA